MRYGIPGTKHGGTKYFLIRGEGIRLGLRRGRWKRIILSVKEPKKVKSLIDRRLEKHNLEQDLPEMVQTD